MLTCPSSSCPSVYPVKRELAVLALVTAMVVAPAASLAASRFVPPRWLPIAERSLLTRAFGGAKPVRTHYISYPKKIAVVLEFSQIVICGMCSSPTAASQPRGKVVRVSFDRRTHRLSGASDGWALRFCEVRDRKPPKSLCLRR
jgi:hypothetical protein